MPRRTRTVLVIAQPVTPPMASGLNDDVTIPCECCDEPVWFSGYAEHMRTCPSRIMVAQQWRLEHDGPRHSRRQYLGEDEDEEDDNENIDDDEDGEGDREDTITDRLGNRFSTITLRFNDLLSLRSDEGSSALVQETNEGQEARDHALQTLTDLIMTTINQGLVTNDYESNILLTSLMGGAHVVGVGSVDTVTSVVTDKLEEMCPICQDTVTHEVRQTSCGHVFCGECISTWLATSKKCPVCMIALED